jgi:hypothetical protein
MISPCPISLRNFTLSPFFNAISNKLV